MLFPLRLLKSDQLIYKISYFSIFCFCTVCEISTHKIIKNFTKFIWYTYCWNFWNFYLKENFAQVQSEVNSLLEPFLIDFLWFIFLFTFCAVFNSFFVIFRDFLWFFSSFFCEELNIFKLFLYISWFSFNSIF